MNRFERLRGASPLVVYVDLKSPYAFIAIEPTRAMARAAGVPVEWRPFTLDIPSYLGAARLDRQGRVVENRRTESQWSGVRYAYRDARRYARLAGMMLRGTEKIWDSTLAGIGLLWARRQSPGIVDRYLDASYRRFWQRELDIEDPAVVAAQLAAAGADVAGFAEFAAGAGRAEHDRINAEAFAAGIFGVPSFLAADEFWFGREHLPRIAWLLEQRDGQAWNNRSQERLSAPHPRWPAVATAGALAPDVAYPVPGDARAVGSGFVPPPRGPDGRARIRVAVDIRDPQALLAFEPTLALARDCAVDVEWLPFEVNPPTPPPDPLPAEDRGTAHRRYRAEHLAREVACYAAARGLALADPYRGADAGMAHLGLLWAARKGSSALTDFLGAALAAYWSGRLAPADPVAVAELLTSVGIASAGFPAWAAAAGRAALAEVRLELREAGVLQVPTFLVGGEPFQGRGHLPLVRALLGAG